MFFLIFFQFFAWLSTKGFFNTRLFTSCDSVSCLGFVLSISAISSYWFCVYWLDLFLVVFAVVFMHVSGSRAGECMEVMKIWNNLKNLIFHARTSPERGQMHEIIWNIELFDFSCMCLARERVNAWNFIKIKKNWFSCMYPARVQESSWNNMKQWKLENLIFHACTSL